MEKPALRRSSAFTLLVLGIAASARADVVTDWNTILLTAVKTAGTPPPRASRAMAMVHVAVYDAVNGIAPTHAPYAVPPAAPAGASPEAAASAAAHSVLCGLFASQAQVFDVALARALAEVPDGPSEDDGVAWGEAVGAAILERRASDGSNAVVRYSLDPTPGHWRPTPPTYATTPLVPHWGSVTPFAMTSGDQFRPDPPPSLTDSRWAADLRQTRRLGAIGSPHRTDAQTLTARFWADGPGTVTPPGHWNQVAQSVAATADHSLAENARLFALMNIAMADAAICSWDAKYAFDFWRPVTAIRFADLDGNPDTEADPTWTPLLVTPPFPECTSGHSTFSAAAAVVLARFHGTDLVRFTTQSDGTPGETREYKRFSDAAEEAGMSRILGGIHFMSANRAGQASGRGIGEHVMNNFLLPLPGGDLRERPS